MITKLLTPNFTVYSLQDLCCQKIRRLVKSKDLMSLELPNTLKLQLLHPSDTIIPPLESESNANNRNNNEGNLHHQVWKTRPKKIRNRSKIHSGRDVQTSRSHQMQNWPSSTCAQKYPKKHMKILKLWFMFNGTLIRHTCIYHFFSCGWHFFLWSLVFENVSTVCNHAFVKETVWTTTFRR